MATGLFGGAFDPPHNGHVALVHRACDHFALERVIVLPTGEPPHKRVETDAEIRYRLAVAAFAELPGVDVSRHELDSPGPSYTADTARWAGARYDDPIFLVGADEFADFPRWRDPDEVLTHLRLGVAARPGYERDALERVLAAVARPERVELFELEPLPIASRDIRERVARGDSIAAFVPPEVAALIDELGLYR